MPKQPRVEDFSALEEPHPYGVLPGGNRFFFQDKRQNRLSEQDILSDGVWQQVLGFCDGSTLAKVAQASKYFYVAGHQPELWRNLVLRRCYSNKKVIDQAKNSWKDTYVALFFNTKEKSYPIHKPIPVSGVYSDEYYRTHLCRSFSIPSVWLEENKNESNLPERKNKISFADENDKTSSEATRRKAAEDPNVIPLVESMTPEEFFENYENLNKPVILKGAGKSNALEQWQDVSYLLKHNAPNKHFRATSGAAPLPADFSLEAYNEYSNFSYLEESPLYLFDRTAFTDNEQWSKDFFPEFYKNCPHWDPAKKQDQYGHDLFQHLGEGRRPDHTWMIMGPKRSGSVFHIDPNATHAWNVCIQGRKRWIFYPPGESPPGVFPSADGDEVALPLSVGEWLMQYWKEHTTRKRQSRQQKKNQKQQYYPMECTVHPGDVIFVPHGWWHMVINLDDRNIAITHNYVSPSNLGNVLKFLQEKEDQISGCRDRKESIKPEFLYNEFVKVLKEKIPRNLEKALAQAASGWTCGAWKDLEVPDLLTTSKESGSDDDESRKRPHDGLQTEEDTRSVMAKTEKVAAFTFSFL